LDIYKLSCEKRDSDVKAKKIRKEGFVPAVVFGPHIDSMNIKIQKVEAEKFLKAHSIGAQVDLDIEGEEQLALLRKAQKDPLSTQTLHIEFYALTSSEAVDVTLPVNYLNRDSVGTEAYLQEELSEIEISTLPKYLIEHVDVDVSKYELGDTVFVKDLDVSNDENIEVLTPADTLVCSITHAPTMEEPEEEEEEVEEAAEVPVVGEEETEEE
jgi:large subunit ribosomal protein L25